MSRGILGQPQSAFKAMACPSIGGAIGGLDAPCLAVERLCPTRITATLRRNAAELPDPKLIKELSGEIADLFTRANELGCAESIHMSLE